MLEVDCYALVHRYVQNFAVFENMEVFFSVAYFTYLKEIFKNQGQPDKDTAYLKTCRFKYELEKILNIDISVGVRNYVIENRLGWRKQSQEAQKRLLDVSLSSGMMDFKQKLSLLERKTTEEKKIEESDNDR